MWEKELCTEKNQDSGALDITEICVDYLGSVSIKLITLFFTATDV